MHADHSTMTAKHPSIERDRVPCQGPFVFSGIRRMMESLACSIRSIRWLFASSTDSLLFFLFLGSTTTNHPRHGQHRYSIKSLLLSRHYLFCHVISCLLPLSFCPQYKEVLHVFVRQGLPGYPSCSTDPPAAKRIVNSEGAHFQTQFA